MTDLSRYGVRGDGVADDTAALQRALDETAGELRLAPGTYRLTRPLEVRLDRGRRAISGSGGTARLLMAGLGPAVRLTGTHRGSAAPEQTAGEVADSQRMPVLFDLEIAGEHPEADGVEIAYAWQPTLSRVQVQRCRHGIHVVANNRNVLISDCHIYHNAGAGIFLDKVGLHQINIIGSHISYNRRGGIKVWRSEIRNLQITGNDIEYNFDRDADVSADVWIETGTSSVREVTIASNTIQAVPTSGGSNIRVIGHSVEVGHKAGLISIAGNIISSQETNVYLQWARGITFTGNTFFNGQRHSIHARQSTHLLVGSCVFDHNPDYPRDAQDGLLFEECEGVTLTGLHLVDLLAGSPERGGAIELRACRGVSITDCQILNPAHRGIALERCDRVLVANCLIADTRAQPSMVEAIRDEGSTRACFTGNLS
ncbi:MAG TPA: right-handed parallel beta-helix repeat-containing protein [Armatimonadota bacterium]|nr:right-handed parallel beta-helix repeat-containing protein [Armatimonadota bacterium]